MKAQAIPNVTLRDVFEAFVVGFILPVTLACMWAYGFIAEVSPW